jgi:phage baseplate assembly protein W
MASRADTITQTLKKVETYSDFTNNFIKHPVTDELIVIKNENSVKQALKNLILTSIGERPFNPYFGSNVNSALFENFDPFAVEDIARYIKLAVQQFEPRVSIINVTVNDIQEQNTLGINIVFAIINNPEPVSLNLFIKRVR